VVGDTDLNGSMTILVALLFFTVLEITVDWLYHLGDDKLSDSVSC